MLCVPSSLNSGMRQAVLAIINIYSSNSSKTEHLQYAQHTLWDEPPSSGRDGESAGSPRGPHTPHGTCNNTSAGFRFHSLGKQASQSPFVINVNLEWREFDL